MALDVKAEPVIFPESGKSKHEHQFQLFCGKSEAVEREAIVTASAGIQIWR